MAIDLEKIKTPLTTVGKIVIGAFTVSGVYFGIINKLDKMESKIDAINLLTDKDKVILENRMAALEADYKEGKDKVGREMSLLTNRVFEIYGVLPKQTKIEDDK